MQYKRSTLEDFERKANTIRYRKKEFDEDFCTFAQRRIQEQIERIERRYKGDSMFLESMDYNVDEVKSLLGVIQKITGYCCGISLKQLKFNLSVNKIIVEESDCQSQRYQHSPIKGACHYHPYVPIIILDGGDIERGKIFTLIYFLVALLAEHQFVRKKISKEKFNRFSSDFWCNMVAGEFLIPKDEFDRQWEMYQGVEVEEIFWKLAEFFQVSKSAIIVKARFTQKISQEAYEEYYKKYDLAQHTCSTLLSTPRGKRIYDDEEVFNQEKNKLYFLLGKVLLENFKSTKSLKICQKVQGLIEEIFKPTYKEMQKAQG